MPKEPLDTPFDNVVLGIVLRIDVAIVGLVPLIFDLFHVPALIHAFNSRDPAVLGLDMNSANGPSGSIFQRDDPDWITASVRPQRVTHERKDDMRSFRSVARDRIGTGRIEVETSGVDRIALR